MGYSLINRMSEGKSELKVVPLTFAEEIDLMAKKMDQSLIIKSMKEPAYNPNYQKLVRFKSTKEQEVWDRLPLTDRQKELLVYDHIGSRRYYA